MPPFLMLFVPANRPTRFSKAAASGADAIIIDLEDAVSPGDRPAARDALCAALSDGGLEGQVFVRLNPAGTLDHAADVAALRGLAIQGIMLAKAEHEKDIVDLHQTFNPPLGVTALIETARGLVNARDLARAGSRLAYGSIDYAYALGMAHERDALLAARSELVLASALGGVDAPLDGVTATITTPEITTEDAAYAKSLGFGGKLLIHPEQIVPALKGWLPDGQALINAQRLLAQTGFNAAMVDGQMVDLPVIAAAQRLVTQAEAIAARLARKD